MAPRDRSRSIRAGPSLHRLVFLRRSGSTTAEAPHCYCFRSDSVQNRFGTNLSFWRRDRFVDLRTTSHARPEAKTEHLVRTTAIHAADWPAEPFPLGRHVTQPNHSLQLTGRPPRGRLRQPDTMSVLRADRRGRHAAELNR